MTISAAISLEWVPYRTAGLRRRNELAAARTQVGALIRQHHGCQRSCDVVANLNHLDTREWTVGCPGHAKPHESRLKQPIW
jgi:hypothetical protein